MKYYIVQNYIVAQKFEDFLFESISVTQIIF